MHLWACSESGTLVQLGEKSTTYLFLNPGMSRFPFLGVSRACRVHRRNAESFRLQKACICQTTYINFPLSSLYSFTTTFTGSWGKEGLRKQTQCPRQWTNGDIYYVGNILNSITFLSLSRYKKELDCSICVRKSGKKLKRKRKKWRGVRMFKDFFSLFLRSFKFIVSWTVY